MQPIARLLVVGTLAVVAFRLAGIAGPSPAPTPARTPDRRVVYLARQLDDTALITLASLAAHNPRAVLLLDTPTAVAPNRAFLAAYRPAAVYPVGVFAGVADIQRRLGVSPRPIVASPRDLWRDPATVVVCPARPRRLLLRGACLAAVRQAPLWVSDGKDAAALRRRLDNGKVRRIVLIGNSLPVPAGVAVHHLRTEQAVAAAHRRLLLAKGTIETAIVCNPDDTERGGTSALAPWVAARKNAALILTGADGTDVERRVKQALRRRSLARLESLILLGNHRALPVVRRPNPIPGDKDKDIEMEPLTPSGNEPESFAVGRLHHADLAIVPLMLARPALVGSWNKALVASNPGNSLPMLETFSRQSAHVLESAGYDVTAIFGKDVTGPGLRRRLPKADLFLWEGHHNTLVKDWAFPTWDEPLPPSVHVLQSCLALQDEKVQPLLTRGAMAVVGTSTRTYSASGGAFSLAYLTAVLHGQTLGGGLRQAKNFLRAWAILKQKRLGNGAGRVGATVRAAWAFSLWGDPTLRLPEARSVAKTPAISHEMDGQTLVLHMPRGRPATVTVGSYRARVPPGAYLAGAVRRGDGAADVVRLLFAEVSLPRIGPDQVPRLRSRLPAGRWVFTWDARRRVGYLLAMPRTLGGDLRFRVEVAGVTVAGR